MNMNVSLVVGRNRTTEGVGSGRGIQCVVATAKKRLLKATPDCMQETARIRVVSAGNRGRVSGASWRSS